MDSNHSEVLAIEADYPPGEPTRILARSKRHGHLMDPHRSSLVTTVLLADHTVLRGVADNQPIKLDSTEGAERRGPREVRSQVHIARPALDHVQLKLKWFAVVEDSQSTNTCSWVRHLLPFKVESLASRL